MRSILTDSSSSVLGWRETMCPALFPHWASNLHPLLSGVAEEMANFAVRPETESDPKRRLSDCSNDGFVTSKGLNRVLPTRVEVSTPISVLRVTCFVCLQENQRKAGYVGGPRTHTHTHIYIYTYIYIPITFCSVFSLGLPFLCCLWWFQGRPQAKPMWANRSPYVESHPFGSPSPRCRPSGFEAPRPDPCGRWLAISSSSPRVF